MDKLKHIKEYVSAIQKRIFVNKLKKGFPVDDIYKEVLYMAGEIGEAIQEVQKGDNTTLGVELADVQIFLLSCAKMIDIDIVDEVEKKLTINEGRTYVKNEFGQLVKE